MVGGPYIPRSRERMKSLWLPGPSQGVNQQSCLLDDQLQHKFGWKVPGEVRKYQGHLRGTKGVPFLSSTFKWSSNDLLRGNVLYHTGLWTWVYREKFILPLKWNTIEHPDNWVTKKLLLIKKLVNGLRLSLAFRDIFETLVYSMLLASCVKQNCFYETIYRQYKRQKNKKGKLCFILDIWEILTRQRGSDTKELDR